MAMAEEHSRVVSELYSIQTAIEQLTPLRSNWSGILRFDTIEGEKGSKTFECDIVIRPDLAYRDVRWRTLIHESFHACSAGYKFVDFNANIGWEEGVVEQLGRLFRQRILAAVGVNFDLGLLAAIDVNHPYNRYVERLEAIRTVLDRQSDEFYLSLLATSIRDRYSSLVGEVLRLPGSHRTETLAVLSAARPALEGIKLYELR